MNLKIHLDRARVTQLKVKIEIIYYYYYYYHFTGGGSQKPVIELEKLKTRKETKTPSLAETSSLPSLSVIKRVSYSKIPYQIFLSFSLSLSQAKSTRSTPKRTQQKTGKSSLTQLYLHPQQATVTRLHLLPAYSSLV